MMKKILIYNRILATYRKAFCNRLAEKLPISVCHGFNSEGIEQSVGNYSDVVRLYQWGKEGTHVFIGGVFKVLNRNVKVVVYEFAIGILSMPIVVLLAKLVGKKVILWSHGYDRKKGFSPETSISDKYRVLLMKLVDRILVYGDADKKILSKYIREEKIFVVHNTLDTDRLFEIRDKLEEEGREIVKNRLGMCGKYNITYIGRVTKSKRPKDLLDLLVFLKKNQNEKIMVHFVGDGSMMLELQDFVKANGLQDDVSFHGRIYDDSVSGEILYASDMMIIPGAIGLSLNHAYCFDCPVITNNPSKFIGHGPEVEYLIDGKTGFFVDPGNILQMANILKSYLSNEKQQLTMRNNVRKKISEDCSMNQMVTDFMRAMNF